MDKDEFVEQITKDRENVIGVELMKLMLYMM